MFSSFGNAFSRQKLSNFFTIARFDPDVLGIFGLLTVIAAVPWYLDLSYLSYPILGLILVIFLIESTERISLSRPEPRRIIGAKCLIIQKATRERRGIVRLFTPDDRLELETWSTEVSSQLVEAGEIAIVTGMNSVILEIQKLD